MSYSNAEQSWVNLDFDQNDQNIDENEVENNLKKMEEMLSDKKDFYALLNLPRDASEESIKDAHRRLSRKFHPDKQADSELRDIAQEQFHRIQRAYEVLIDPKLRAVYDNFGESGLEAKLHVGQRYKTAAELRKEFEEKAAKDYQKEIEDLVRAKGGLTVQVDASKLVSETVQDHLIANNMKRDPIPRIRMMSLRHSVDTEISPNIRLNLAASMVSKDKQGTGNIVGTLRYTHGSHATYSIAIPFINPQRVTLKSSFRPKSDTFYNIDTTLKRNALPAAVFTAGRSLRPNMTAFISMQSGNELLHSILPQYNQTPREKSSATVGLTGVQGKFNYNTQLTTTVRMSNMAFNLSRNLDSNFKLNGGLMIAAAGSSSGLIGLGAITTHFGGSVKITSTTTIGWTSKIGIPTGVQFNLNFSHLGQTLSLPIFLAPAPEPDLILLSAVVPAIIGVGLHYSVFRPRRRRRLLKRIEELKEGQARVLEARKLEAEHAVKLMKSITLRNRQAEIRAGGLVIENAIYGDISTLAEDGGDILDSESVVDVTIPLQALVMDKHLVLPSGVSKSQLIGFYDPCFGVSKKLHIEYLFRGEKHTVTVKDNDPVALPLRGHLVNKKCTEIPSNR